MRIVIATANPGKLQELRNLLAPIYASLFPRSEFSVEEVPETGLSFAENAIIKARHAASVSGLPAIADDSGIEVDALHGAPGIYSARYAGSQASDRDNLQKLLHELRDVPEARRTARYRCVLVYMRRADDPFPLICSGTWNGLIASAPSGQGGFGYDPIFYLPELRLTAAELSSEEKNRRSHRGQALRCLLRELSALEEPVR